MKAEPDDFKISDILQLKSQQMLVVNSEYQRGPVWTSAQKKKLVDSVLRGYPIPLIYLHHIRREAGGLDTSQLIPDVTRAGAIPRGAWRQASA